MFPFFKPRTSAVFFGSRENGGKPASAACLPGPERTVWIFTHQRTAIIHSDGHDPILYAALHTKKGMLPPSARRHGIFQQISDDNTQIGLLHLPCIRGDMKGQRNGCKSGLLGHRQIIPGNCIDRIIFTQSFFGVHGNISRQRI